MYDFVDIPSRAGVGLKAEHYDAILGSRPDVGWFEVHAENYMGAGGPPHRYLEAIRTHYPLSLHGVGLSIGSKEPLDQAHLQRLKQLNDRYKPGLFSEHLAWSTHDGVYLNDLLPLPYTAQTLDQVCDHIETIQDVVGRRMLLENPSTYVVFEESSMSETAFLDAIVQRTGCGLLLDINNVFVSATNHGYSPTAYIDYFPLDHVGEIHLAGHAEDQGISGEPLLIDAHDREVAAQVWALYAHVIGRIGPRPTLIEWDNDIPDWPSLQAEAEHADRIMKSANASHVETV